MPTYTFECKKTGKQVTKVMSIAERDEWLAKHKQHFQVILPLGVRDNFVASRHTNIPIDTEFKDILKSIRDNNHQSTIDW